MKTLRNILLGTVLAGSLVAPALAESGSINVGATAVSAITITEGAPVEFGLFEASGGGHANATCTLFADAVLDCPAGPPQLGGHSVGQLDLTGTPGATVLVELARDVLDASGSIRFDVGLCDTAGGPGTVCGTGDGWTTTLVGGLANISVGGLLRFVVAPTPPQVYTIPVGVTVNYI